MLISYNWLKKYLNDFEINDLEQFKNKLDTRLSEIASVSVKGAGLSKLVIAEIKTVEPHPTNHALSVCTVDDGSGSERTIVCGAPNVRPGLKSVLCQLEGKVYNPTDNTQIIDIAEREIAGVKSQGMLCSTAELGMLERHTEIIEVPAEMPNGTPVTQMLQDMIIEIENKSLAHRPDTFSHLGIARELAAIYKTSLQVPEPQLSQSSSEQQQVVKITNQAHELCPRYSGISISGVKVGVSPLWLQIALAHVGIKSINNVVDVTNFVMMDMGQPLHAFDYNKLDEKLVVVRTSKAGEKLTTLDDQERDLPAGTLVIAEREKPIAIAGIMGGLSSAIDENTQNVFLEAANFEMFGIRRASRALGLRTDASSRYEKGIDPASTVPALIMAANMIVDLCGGEIASELYDVYPAPESPQIVDFDLGVVKRLLGIDIDKIKLLDILQSLQFEVIGAEKVSVTALTRAEVDSVVQIKVPSFRRDIKGQEDILEEIARLYGYENITLTIPKRDLRSPKVNKQKELLNNMRQYMAGSGLTEVYTYTMVGKALWEQTLLDTSPLPAIQSPISPELAFVRNQLTPSLLAKLQLNSSKYTNFGLFELAKIANKQLDSKTKLPQQQFQLAAARIGEQEITTYRQLKFALDNLIDSLQLPIKIEQTTKGLPPFLHPGKSGLLQLDGKTIGSIGILHPTVTHNFDLNGSVAVWQLDLQTVLEAKPEPKPFQTLSNFPSVIRDLSFWQAPQSNVADFTAKLQEQNLDLLENIQVVDVYYKSETEQSFSVRLTLQATDHTLTGEEINAVVEKVTKLALSLKHKLR